MLKVAFYKQTPYGKLLCPAENAVQREGLGQLPGSSGSSWRLASLELESFAIITLFKKSPLKASMSCWRIQCALPRKEWI